MLFERNLHCAGFHIAARMMIMYNTMVGGSYRREILAPTVARVCAHPEMYEIDPAHLTPGFSLRQNVINLLDLLGTC